MKILSVVGARPNFIKIAPFIKAIETYNILSSYKIEHCLVHTGQHYDDRMSRAFFRQLEIPEADINLGIGSGSHAEQVGNTMIEFEKVLRINKPDWVVVIGDVNAILACSVTAKKEHILCCHIEAGLRSFDISMPEEINRLVTDRISDLLLTPDRISSENLLKEGIPGDKIRFTGNIMIDTLESNRNKAEKLDINEIIKKNSINGSWPNFIDSSPFDFAVITIHRPSNVDNKFTLEQIVRFIIDEASKTIPLIWTIHPRTLKMLKAFGLLNELLSHNKVILLKPLCYLEMLKLNMHARVFLTDSGGLQEECTILGTPCLTFRLNTERPVTLRENGGASVLVGNNINLIIDEYHNALNKPRIPVRPEFWDGHAAERCLKAILDF